MYMSMYICIHDMSTDMHEALWAWWEQGETAMGRVQQQSWKQSGAHSHSNASSTCVCITRCITTCYILPLFMSSLSPLSEWECCIMRSCIVMRCSCH